MGMTPGGEMTQFGTEARQHNVLGQLTRITKPGAMDLEYRYSATANDGRITSQKGYLTGEKVVYQYDALKRLMRAETTGPQWGQSFTYDGWGNLRAMNVVKGSAPVMSTTADPATNRLGAWSYDANGNATAIPGASTLNLVYDAANRMARAYDSSSVDESYAYAPDNRRVWKAAAGQAGVYTFWGPDGTRMAEYSWSNWQGSLVFVKTATQPPLTFMGKRIATEDRLGSMNGSYYPYGQPKSGQSGTGERYATYYKDATGLEYAVNRYYSTTWGRFTSADPYSPSGGPEDPASWNRYSYVGGDPVGYLDPQGLAKCVWVTVGTTFQVHCAYQSNRLSQVRIPSQSSTLANVLEKDIPDDVGSWSMNYMLAVAAAKGLNERLTSNKDLMNDCEALYLYALQAFSNTNNADEFVSAFGVFLHDGESGVQSARRVGILVSSVSSEHRVLFRALGRTGYKRAYQDADALADQAHHFSSFPARVSYGQLQPKWDCDPANRVAVSKSWRRRTRPGSRRHRRTVKRRQDQSASSRS